MRYSKDSLRLLATYGDGGPDTPEAAAERKRRNVAAERVRAEREFLYPVVTAENFEVVNAWQEARLAELEDSDGTDSD